VGTRLASAMLRKGGGDSRSERVRSDRAITSARKRKSLIGEGMDRAERDAEKEVVS